MLSRVLLSLGLMICGCMGDDVTPAPLPTTPAEQPDPVDPDKPAKAKPEAGSADESGTLTEPKELVLSGGVKFTAPKGWREVPVTGNIPEAEFALPKLGDDEHDGRLTLMSALGGIEANMPRWKGEFNKPGEPKVEKMKIDGVEVTVVDIRGEWKGTSFRPIDPPRPDHRLIAVYIPLGESDAYYIKLTGPKGTLAERDEEIQAFLKSGKIEKK